MVWPFLYVPGDRLSVAELAAARLDGDIVEVGDAFMPADAVETAELRAASLRAILGEAFVASYETAAWVHGALSDPPAPHHVQRTAERRTAAPLDARIRFRDVPVPRDERVRLGRVWVTTPVRTFTDLVRELVGGHPASAATSETLVAAMIAWNPDLPASGLAALAAGPPVHHRRGARDYLAARGLPEVTTT